MIPLIGPGLAERAAALASRIGLSGLAIAVLVAMLFVQTTRIEGFSVWPLRHEGWKPRAERLARDLDNVKAAQVVALERALAEKHKAETKYLKLANRIQEDAQNDRAAALGDAERYIAANRVRCEAAGRTGSGTVTATADHSAGHPQGAGSVPELDGGLVAVPAEDVRICSVNTVKAQAGHELAVGLEAASR